MYYFYISFNTFRFFLFQFILFYSNKKYFKILVLVNYNNHVCNKIRYPQSS